MNTPTTLDLTVELGSVATTVEVTASAAAVNTQDATLGNAFGQTQISSLPFEGRDPIAILSLQPGVVFVADRGQVDLTQDSRGGSVNGARSDQTNVTLDGIDNNDQIFGFAFTGALRATLDSIEEFRVTTTNSNADQGRSSGAQVALLTKSGGNQIHGSAYEYHRPTNLVANDFFNKHAQLQNGRPNKPTHLLRNTFGGSVGGPIKMDRFFWFAAYEGQRTRENTQATRAVPSAGLRDGAILYQCQDASQCAGGSVQGISGATYNVPVGFNGLGPTQIAQMDPNCSANGTCPWGPGVDPNTIAVMNQYPLPNSNQLGDGFNFRAFTFSAATPFKLDTYVIKLDANLTQNGNHRAFVRSGLQSDHFNGVPEFPGQVPATVNTNNTKGIISGYTWTISPTKINNLRYGYIRQGIGNNGVSNQHFAFLRGLVDSSGNQAPPVAATRTTNVIIPVHNLVDDFSWIRGKHTVQFGGNFRKINNLRASNAQSFNDAITNAGFLPTTGFANKGTSLDPAKFGFPAVAKSFANSYDFPMTALAGIITEVDATYQRDKAGMLLPEGTLIHRHFRAFELEWYLQDSWGIKPNLTFTYGARYTLLQPPYEANGLQVAPDMSLNDFFTRRMNDMVQGKVFRPVVHLDLSGQANGKKPYWDWDYRNIAPRISMAWSPGYRSGLLKALFGGPGKSSIRIGYGIYFDHFGAGIVNTFDRNGSFGLTTTISDPPGTVNVDTAPRYTGLHDIPTSIQPPPPPNGFPATPPGANQLGSFAITWGLDDKLKTPYSHAYDLSFTRELPGGFVFEAAYVGRIGRRLLQERDLAMPLNLFDPKSKMSYFQAASMLSNLAETGTDISQVTPISYWENLFPTAAGGTGQVTPCAPNPNNISTFTATQAMYDNFFCNLHNETTALFLADLFCFPGCATINGVTAPFQFFHDQWASLYAWSSIGRSSYNAGQFMLRHKMSHGLQWDFNYTYSKSIDTGSDAERISLFEGFGFGSQIINSFQPTQLRSPSDFDALHQINSNWVYELPLGRGRRWGHDWNRGLNAVLGGWSFSGLFRWSSGLTFSIGDGFNFPTNWELTGNAFLRGAKTITGTFTDRDSDPNVFNFQGMQNSDFVTKFFRFARPGESGQRNNLRGPGYFGIDAAIRKTWKLTESQGLSFTWETFNITNSVRFDAATTFPAIDTSGSFGKFSKTLTRPRVMEFALRYTF